MVTIRQSGGSRQTTLALFRLLIGKKAFKQLKPLRFPAFWLAQPLSKAENGGINPFEKGGQNHSFPQKKGEKSVTRL